MECFCGYLFKKALNIRISKVLLIMQNNNRELSGKTLIISVVYKGAGLRDVATLFPGRSLRREVMFKSPL